VCERGDCVLLASLCAAGEVQTAERRVSANKQNTTTILPSPHYNHRYHRRHHTTDITTTLPSPWCTTHVAHTQRPTHTTAATAAAQRPMLMPECTRTHTHTHTHRHTCTYTRTHTHTHTHTHKQAHKQRAQAVSAPACQSKPPPPFYFFPPSSANLHMRD
jgi:hypothetical protein